MDIKKNLEVFGDEYNKFEKLKIINICFTKWKTIIVKIPEINIISADESGVKVKIYSKKKFPNFSWLRPKKG